MARGREQRRSPRPLAVTAEQNDETLTLLVYRVGVLETDLKEARAEVRVARSEARQYFDQLHAALANLAFVPLALYLSERDGLQKDIKGAFDHADEARKMGLAAFGTIASAVVGAVIIAIATVLR